MIAKLTFKMFSLLFLLLLAALACGQSATPTLKPYWTEPSPSEVPTREIIPSPPEPAEGPAQTEPATSEFPVKLSIDPQAVPPSDVLEQVDFSVPAAGLISCIDGPTAVTDPVSIGESIEWCFCEIEDEQPYTVKLVDPNGAIIIDKETTAHLSYFQQCDEGGFSRNLLLPGVPLGVYTLQLITSEVSLALPFTLLPAEKPTILETGSSFILAGFRPQEAIRLLAYKYLPSGGSKSRFVGEWWLQADQDGLLSLEMDPEVYLYAIGAQSGEAAPLIDDQTSFRGHWINYAGPFSLYATLEALEELPVYALPSNQTAPIASLPPGARLLVDSSPYSNNGLYWWHVNSYTGVQGWIEERHLKLVDFEPNDAFEQAADLIPLDPNYRRFARLPLEIGDRDFYRLQLQSAMVSIYAYLTGDWYTELPIVLVLYDSYGNPIGETDKPHIGLYATLPQDGVYYIQVYDNGLTDPVEYTLVIQ